MYIKIEITRHKRQTCGIKSTTWPQKVEIVRAKRRLIRKNGDHMRQSGDQVGLYGSRPRRIYAFWIGIEGLKAPKTSPFKKIQLDSIKMGVRVRLNRAITGWAGGVGRG